MKKLSYLLGATLMFLAAACSEEAVVTVSDSAAVQISAQIESAISTRAYGEGDEIAALSYAVYNESDNTLVAQGDHSVMFSDGTAILALSLQKGYSYTIALWADGANGVYSFNAAAGTITVDYAQMKGNDEANDAFFAAVSTGVINDTYVNSAVLQRPLAQLNFGATDKSAADLASTEISVIVPAGIPTVLNLLTGEASVPTTAAVTLSATGTCASEGNTYPAGEQYVWVAKNYLLVGNDAQVLADEVVLATGLNATTVQKSIANVTIQRNYRTNISGELFTVDGEINISYGVSFDPKFNDGDINNQDEEQGDQDDDAEEEIDEEKEAQLALEREMLISIYETTYATKKWSSSTNWNTDADVSTWYGITCDEDGYVTSINLASNSIYGKLPTSLDGTFIKLETFYLYSNYITNLPEWWADYMHLGVGNVSLCYNRLNGSIPDAVVNHENFAELWPDLLYQRSGYRLTITDVTLPAPEFEVTDLYGNTINSNDVYSNNDYAIIADIDYYSSSSSTTTSQTFMSYLKTTYSNYSDAGLYALTYINSTASSRTAANFQSYMESNGYTWPAFFWSADDNYISAFNTKYLFSYPTVFGINCAEKTVIWQTINNSNSSDYTNISSYVSDWIGDYLYTSTDYSMDGEVIRLQSMDTEKYSTANGWYGLDFVFLGDGFTDKMHKDGGDDDENDLPTDTYTNYMKEAMEMLFSLEPMTSFRDLCNVYTVRVVSPNSDYDNSDAEFAFHDPSNTSTTNTSRDDLAYSYANSINNSQLCVNDIYYPLITILYNCNSKVATSYCNWNTDNSCLTYLKRPLSIVLVHETIGHGLAHLVDEYTTKSGNISQSSSYTKNLSNESKLADWWYRNCDTTSDASSIKWAHFLSNSDYDNEDLGIIEGNYTYYEGAYRPSNDSMMRSNQEFWNAPSRECIYWKIHNLATRYNWTYNLSDFLAYDKDFLDMWAGAEEPPTRANSQTWDCEESEPVCRTTPWNANLVDVNAVRLGK